jgi:dipeptidyl aminopeptidase/acylaminoacyl peptidase
LINRELGDLAILDLRTHRVRRIASRVTSEWWSFSPDQKYAAYTTTPGWEPDSQKPIHQIVVYELATGKSRILAAKAHLNYGIEINWSPDSRQIAYIDTGKPKGELVAISLADGLARNFSTETMPSFSEGEGERAPMWDASAQNLYAVGVDGKLWKVEVASGHAAPIGAIAGHSIGGIIARTSKPTIWTTDNGGTAWVVAHETKGSKAGIFRVDLANGRTTAALEDDRAFANPVFNLDVTDATGEIAYVAQDQQHMEDAWVLNTATGHTQQATHLNERLEHYELGTPHLIEWYSFDGQKLTGTLLLPPGYRKGQRVPLVVWIYGGRNGSEDFNRFGLWGQMPLFNFHVLATRGYAILEPDAPLRTGMQMRDLMATVMPGVDAAIAQGYADPDRLAVMGQSYGSYCTLALISQTTRFKAAVITAAVMHPDLIADYLNSDPDIPSFHTGFYEQGQGNMHATPWENRDRYLDNSPVYLFDRVQTPLLIGQGSKDSFGHNQLPSDATFAALKRLGKNVEYRIYKDESHVLSSTPNVIDFWQRRLEFLAEHLNIAIDAQGSVVFNGDSAKSAKPE